MNNKTNTAKKNKKTNNKINNISSNNFGALLKKDEKENLKYKKSEKKINKENKRYNPKENINEQKINNFFDDVDDLDEDYMQKLDFKPTPIYQPNKRITFEKRKKYALQKKTNTERDNNENEEENSENLYNNNTYCKNDKDEINSLIISSGSVDSKLKKGNLNLNNDKLLNNMKKSFEGKNILDRDFDDIEQKKGKKNIFYEDYEIDNDATHKLNEDEYLEQDKEEIKIEINKDNKLKNNYYSNENRNDQEENSIINNNNNHYENNNENIITNNNKTEELSTVTNTIPMDNIEQEQENLISYHIDTVKSEAKLLSEEGNLISKIKGISEESYSMEEYMPKLEEIIKLKLAYFKELKQRIEDYKK